MVHQNNIQKGGDKMKKNTPAAQTTTHHKEETMSQLTFTVEKMYCLPDAGALKAFADIGVNGALVIRGVRILSGKKGLFVSLPKEQGKDNKWYDQVVCKDAAVYDALATVLLAHYQENACAAV